jgi:diguanylate cyclase (GGDEF)-like protein/PAS domain S-box-containing protein
MQLAFTAAPIRGETTKKRTADIIRMDRQAQLTAPEPAMQDSARQLVELSPEAILVSRDNILTLLNQAAGRLLGARHADQLLGRSLFDFVHPEFHALFHERARLSVSDGASTPFMEQVWLRLDGTRFHAEIAATNLIYDDSPAVQIVVRDITERKRNEELQLGQNRILNMVATGAELPDILAEIAQFIETQFDQALCSIRILGDDSMTLTGDAGPGLAERCKTPKARSSWPILGKDAKMLGTLTICFREVVATSAEDQELLNICTRLAGIAIESRASEERIRFLAHYDGLTSLPNRFLFKEYLDQALRNSQRHASQFAVFFLDLDKFKEINDTYGHAAGDQVLREIAARLRAALRDTDKIARMGGDEFYVLIEDLKDGRHAASVAQKLLDAASRPVYIDQKECQLSVSIGIAIYPEDGTDGKALLKNADGAMYRAKELGKNGYQFISSTPAQK